MLGISWGIVSVVMLLAYGEGFNQALLRGFQGAFGDGVSIVFAGQTSMQAGGERAGKRIRMRMADAEAVGRAAAGEGVEPGVLQQRHRGVADEAGLVSRPGRGPGVRAHAVAGGGRGALHRRRGRAAAAALGVPRQRGGAQAVRQLAAGRRDRAHQRHGLHRGRRAEGEDAALQLQPSRQGERVHPVHDRRPAVEHGVPQHAGLRGDGSDAQHADDESGEGRPRQAPALQPGRRARAANLRVGRARRRSPTASCSA